MPSNDSDPRSFEIEYLKALPRFVLQLDLVGMSAYVLEKAAEIVLAPGGALVLVTEGKPVVAACRGLAKDVVARVHSAAAGAPSSSAAAARVGATLGTVWGTGRRILHAPLHVDKDVVGHVLLMVEQPPNEERRTRLNAFLTESGVALQQAQLVHSAAFDRSTGVHTADYLFARLEEEVSRAVRYKRRIALLLFEVDRYALIREVSGPVVAEQALHVVVEVMRSGLRRVDIIGRFRDGGFAVVLPETGLAPALTIARRIARQVQEAGLQDGSRWVDISVSGAGIAFPQEARDLDSLWVRAEELLDAARAQGGGRVFSRKDLPGASAEAAEAGTRPDIDQLALSKEGRALLGMVARMAAGRDMGLAALQQHIVTTLVEIARCDRGAIALLDAQGNPDSATVRYTHAAPADAHHFPVDFGILRKAVEAGREMVWNPPVPGEDEPAGGAAPPSGRKRRAYLCAPVLYDGKPIGAVLLEHLVEHKRFAQEDVDLIGSSLEVLGGILQATRLEERRQRELIEVKEVAQRALHELEARFSYANIIGKSKSMQSLFRVLERVAETRHAVLIQGESGTGKELVARAVHYNGQRRDKPFLAENCAALPGTLLEAELFGYVKGAFTGATTNKKGLLEVADGGTLFLDEIGEMSEPLQRKLLRVLEDKEFRPLGGKHVVRSADVRFIAATNRDLTKMIADGAFREDLYYRLNVVNITLPPLRERKEDIPLLVGHFLDAVAKETGHPRKTVANDAMRLLLAHDWPGNIRELENTLKNVCVFTDGPVLTAESFAHLDRFRTLPAEAGPLLSPQENVPDTYQDILARFQEMERKCILDALQRAGNNKWNAAKALGMTRPALYRAMKRLGIAD